MKTRLLLTFFLLLSLSACARQIAKPVAPVDYQLVREHATALAQPTEVYGEIQHRYEAKDGGELWTFSGRQEIALNEANASTSGLLRYILGVIDELEKAASPAPKCRLFGHFLCKPQISPDAD
jgi:hypothetical protein